MVWLFSLVHKFHQATMASSAAAVAAVRITDDAEEENCKVVILSRHYHLGMQHQSEPVLTLDGACYWQPFDVCCSRSSLLKRQIQSQQYVYFSQKSSVMASAHFANP